MVTTLHGTDITLVGNDPSYSEIVAFSIDQSDHVTAVSKSLRDSTYAELGVQREIEVIPNFLDCGLHKRQHVPTLRERFTDGDPDVRIVAHISNFRPVKHIDHVVAVFDRIRRRVPARLLLVGDGPELPGALRTARELGIAPLVHAVGAQEEVLPLLSVSDLFLLPSAEESFGLAALEAMACGVPVVASRVGGVPEVIEHGKSGYPAPARCARRDGRERRDAPDAIPCSTAPPARPRAAASPTRSAPTRSCRCTRPPISGFSRTGRTGRAGRAGRQAGRSRA